MFKFGDIVLTNFDPSVGREYKKVRPAIVIQEERVNRYSPYFTIMPISSKVENLQEHDIYVSKDIKNKLMSDSVIKVTQITSFDKTRFFMKIGQINSPVARRVRGYLRKHFGL